MKIIRRQATEREKIPKKHTSDEGLLSKTYKELLKLSNKRTINSITKWVKRPEQTSLSRKVYKWQINV